MEQDLFAGCNLDYNTMIVGGIGKKLVIYDVRTGRKLLRPVDIPAELIQITKILRFTSSELIVSNINELYTLDIRQMKLVRQAKT